MITGNFFTKVSHISISLNYFILILAQISIMKKILYCLTIILLYLQHSEAQIWPAGLAGRWTFDNTANLLQATVGNNLALNGTHAAVPGAFPGDGAALIGLGSYYTCSHGIAANGGGSLVNEYSILFDVMIDNPKVYHSLFQTNMSNTNDGDGFINTNSQIGISATGYSGFACKARRWYRIVLTVDLGSSLRYYVDGHKVLEGTSQAVDGTYSLDPSVLFFADENGEDNNIYVSQLAIFNNCLTAAQVYGLGGFRSSDIQPYLQSPTVSFIYVSWYSLYNTGTSVQYGTTYLLGQQAIGTYQDIGVVRWHSVNVTGLTADTKYYYRCISGTDTSAMSSFCTPPLPTATGKHIRFLKFGDSQDDAIRSAMIADTAVWLMKQLYGNNWYDSINLVMHSGDLTQDGATLATFMNEYFNTFSVLSSHIPFMVSIGNHEGESSNYYNFMKYEGFTGFNERYYTYNLGNCQFLALNTSGLYNNILQTNWVQNQLNASASDPDIDFVFCHSHHPAHSEIWPDGNSSYVQDNLLPLFKTYPKMVMYTYGHSHNFERGVIRSTHAGNWDFRTVLSGGAGGPLDRWGMYTNQQDYPENQKSIDNYNFLLVDVNMDQQTVKTYTYSLGNTDRPRNVELIDKWHRYLNQPAPVKPLALAPSSSASLTPTLISGPFNGQDTLMSSEFQLVATTGSFSSPLIDVSRDSEDFYGDSGSPLFNPMNLNTGINLKRYTVLAGLLTSGQTYMWRVRFRDKNVRWSDWSDPLTFTAMNSANDAVDFIADVVSGNAPLTVHFTDLSVYNPFSWQWDLNGDNLADDYTQDPVYSYTIPGLYTVSLTSQVGSQILTNTKNGYINVLATGIEEREQGHISAYPNPSSAKVTVAYSNAYGKVDILITDLNGKILNSFTDYNVNGGVKSFTWDGCNAAGSKVAAGIYLCRIKADNFSSTVKMIRY